MPLTICHTENIYIYVGTHNVTLAVEARSAWGYTVGWNSTVALCSLVTCGKNRKIAVGNVSK